MFRSYEGIKNIDSSDKVKTLVRNKRIQNIEYIKFNLGFNRCVGRKRQKT